MESEGETECRTAKHLKYAVSQGEFKFFLPTLANGNKRPSASTVQSSHYY